MEANVCGQSLFATVRLHETLQHLVGGSPVSVSGDLRAATWFYIGVSAHHQVTWNEPVGIWSKLDFVLIGVCMAEVMNAGLLYSHRRLNQVKHLPSIAGSSGNGRDSADRFAVSVCVASADKLLARCVMACRRQKGLVLTAFWNL